MFVKPSLLSAAIAAALFSASAMADFGADMDAKLAADAYDLFGFTTPLSASATMPVGYARSASGTAATLVTVATGLTATILTRTAAHHTDMFSFWPAGASPTHMISCVEGGRAFITDGGTADVFDAGDKMNPSVQAIDLTTGAVTTLLRGMDRCDGIRTTDWGTVLATEETDDGGAYELLLPTDPTAFTEATVTSRAAGTIVDSSDAVTDAFARVAKRDTLPTMAWEGLEVLSSGVVIGGDELRPGSGTPDSDGGGLFKFVPAVPRTTTGNISALTESPLVNGSAYALRVSCTTGTQYGQGCEVGNGAWVGVTAATARADADANGATGFYRPEDLHLDPVFTGTGVRFCWANTGNEGAKHYGEVMCGVDSDPTSAVGNNVVINRFVEGDTDFNSVDNLAFQPVSGNLYVIEDHSNGDVFACLPDGTDRDIKTDGCARMLSVIDTSAEPTGFMFSPDGLTAYVSVQHSNDPVDGSMDSDGYGTDDIIKITGFAAPVAY